MSQFQQPPWRSIPEEGEHEYAHWNRVYLMVVLFTIVTIIALWLFERAFNG